MNDMSTNPLAALRSLEPFRTLTEGELRRISDAAEVVTVAQDRILSRAGEEQEEPAYYFVLRGQLAFAEFAMGMVPRVIPKKKRTTPTMQIARKTVALFDVGDFFTNEHVQHARGEDGVKYEMAIYTCLHVEMARILKSDFDRLMAQHPAVKTAIEVLAEESYYRQTILKVGERAEIFDFYVRQGFEYADAIKIIQTDKCIDCDECVKGCEDRHGIARIERFGPRLGLVQFTLNCRNCEDPRCVDVCNFDAIDQDDNLEVIVYDNCVGCTLCAKACPHEAIRMVDVQDESRVEGGVDIVQMAKGPDAVPQSPYCYRKGRGGQSEEEKEAEAHRKQVRPLLWLRR